MSSRTNALERPDDPMAPRMERLLHTPDGVPLRLTVAGGLARSMAFAIDMGIISGASTMLGLALILGLSVVDGWAWFAAIFTLCMFFLRNFYFAFFEVRWRGRSPGKRMLGLRVIDARGGVLQADAIFIRNLMRDVEISLPMMLLVYPLKVWSGEPMIVRVACLIWLAVLLVFPLLNRDRLRVGDLVAGTLVVHEPALVRLQDTIATETHQATYTFTQEQLDMYGIYELQVLEEFLGQYPSAEAIQAVAERVVEKIAWDDPRWTRNPGRFLRDFYHALRGRREQQLLMGKRQETKRTGKLQRVEREER